MKWIYEHKELTSLPEGAYGFIYWLKLSDGTKYIGKKACKVLNTLPARKDGVKRKDHSKFVKKYVMLNPNTGSIVTSKPMIRKLRAEGQTATIKTYEEVYKESNWKTYLGSSEELDTSKVESKVILAFAYSKRELTYLETKQQFINNVLEDKEYLNKNINGMWFKDNLR